MALHMHSASCLLSVWLFCCLYQSRKKFFLQWRWSISWLTAVSYLSTSSVALRRYKTKNSFKNRTAYNYRVKEKVFLPKELQESEFWASATQVRVSSHLGQREKDSSVYASLPRAAGELLGTEKWLVPLPCLNFRKMPLSVLNDPIHRAS